MPKRPLEINRAHECSPEIINSIIYYKCSVPTAISRQSTGYVANTPGLFSCVNLARFVICSTLRMCYTTWAFVIIPGNYRQKTNFKKTAAKVISVCRLHHWLDRHGRPSVCCRLGEWQAVGSAVLELKGVIVWNRCLLCT